MTSTTKQMWPNGKAGRWNIDGFVMFSDMTDFCMKLLKADEK